jgi:rRNA processing protein Krr1/Pno1
MVGSKIKEGERLAYVLELDTADAWILSAIIGKNGSNVAALRTRHPQCKIEVLKESRSVTVVGSSESAVQSVREELLADVEKARAETAFLVIPDPLISKFVGKGGAHVKEMSSSLGVDIARVHKGQFNFKLSGDAANVEAAKKAVDDWIVKRQEADGVLSFKLEREKDVPAILGEKGNVARALQVDHKCKIDIDRKTLLVSIKAETEETRAVVLKKIKDLIAEGREKAAIRRAAQKQEQAEGLIETNESSGDAPPRTNSNNRKSPSRTSSTSNDVPPLTTDTTNRNGPSRDILQNHVDDTDIVSKDDSKDEKKIESGSEEEAPTFIDTSIDEGTENGRNLFALLISDT